MIPLTNSRNFAMLLAGLPECGCNPHVVVGRHLAPVLRALRLEPPSTLTSVNARSKVPRSFRDASRSFPDASVLRPPRRSDRSLATHAMVPSVPGLLLQRMVPFPVPCTQRPSRRSPRPVQARMKLSGSCL